MISAWRATSQALERFRRRINVERRVTPDFKHDLPFEPIRLVTQDHITLAAWYVPAPKPTTWGVVLHHHFGGQKAYVIPWLALFHRLGLACVAFDARGHGGSQGRIDLDSFDKRGADGRAAVQALRERGITNIVGFGQSQGAAVLLLGISQDPSVRGLIFDSGPAPEMWSAVWGVASMLAGNAQTPVAPRVLLAARIMLRADPLRYLLGVWPRFYAYRHKPLLWLHGDKDQVIPRALSQLWFSAFANKESPWHAVRVSQADHVRTLQVGGPFVENEVRLFLQNLMKA